MVDQWQWREPRRNLTPREIEIVKLTAEGLEMREIAAKLYLSPHTVKSYLGRIFGAWNCRNKAQMVAQAFHRGVVLPDKTEITGPMRATRADRKLFHDKEAS